MALQNMMKSLQTYRGDTGQPFQPRTGFKNWLSGNPELFRQVPRHSPEIMQQLQGLLGQTFQGLQNPYQGFEDISNEAVHNYQTQGVPSLAERFTALGGGQRSSAFQSALAGGEADLQRSLAAAKQGFGQQNRQGLLDQLNLGLKNQPDFVQTPKQSGWLEGLLGPLLGGGSYRGALGGQSEGLQLLANLLKYLV